MLQKMNPHVAMISLVLCAAGCTSHVLPQADTEERAGCSHDRELPPLKLGPDDKRILANRSNPPRSASDYYLALPSSCFSIVENTPERRVSFIEKQSLTASYLHAEHWFECDGGGFEVTMRLFDAADGPLVAVSSSTYESATLYSDDNPGPGGLASITVCRPRFWRYKDGTWLREDDAMLPMISRDFVIDRYRNHYKAHLQTADQRKSIWLNYDLPTEGNVIRVTGRENFMDPSGNYFWAAFRFDGKRFVREGL